MKIAVLLSGGVDSSTALMSLKDQGFTDITAYYLKIWLEDDTAYLGECPWEEDLAYARKVCEQAGIELKVVPLQLEYYDKVVEYALAELRQGRTPSPDIFCNQRIKFGTFFGKLDQLGDLAASHDELKVASGHYARIDHVAEAFPLSLQAAEAPSGPTATPAGAPGRWRLLRAPDPVKDQSYFLSHLSQEQLGRILFPIGAYHKDEVRGLAHQWGLANQDRPDSQGICFLGKIRYPDFVRHYLGERDGPIIERETGAELGRHGGFWFHTTGQRAGLGLGNGPWYVSAKDCQRNVVYVSHGSHSTETARSDFRVSDLHWLPGRAPSAAELAVWNSLGASDWAAAETAGATSEASHDSHQVPNHVPVGLCLKLRHGPQLLPCRLAWAETAAAPANSPQLQVTMSRGDRGIAAGQFAVFYLGEECLGSGKIIENDAGELESYWRRHLDWTKKRSTGIEAQKAARQAKNQARREKYGLKSTSQASGPAPAQGSNKP